MENLLILDRQMECWGCGRQISKTTIFYKEQVHFIQSFLTRALHPLVISLLDTTFSQLQLIISLVEETQLNYNDDIWDMFGDQTPSHLQKHTKF